MKQSITLKISIAILILLSSGLALIAYLNYAKFAKTYDGIEQSRYETIAAELKQSIESSLDLGLSLTQNQNLETVIKNAKRTFSRILFIEISDNNGEALFSTEPPEDFEAERIHNRNMRITKKIENSFGEVVGQISLNYSTSQKIKVFESVRKYLTSVFFSIIAMFSFIAFISVHLLFKKFGHSLHLASTASLGPIDDENTTVKITAANKISQHINEFRYAVVDTVATLNEVEATLADASL
ncbi:hypothetical protein CCP2SC5_110009 [Azospirillaceae bacterium]